jgi:hypothetical protein
MKANREAACRCGHPMNEHTWESPSGKEKTASECWHRDMIPLHGGYQSQHCLCLAFVAQSEGAA